MRAPVNMQCPSTCSARQRAWRGEGRCLPGIAGGVALRRLPRGDYFFGKTPVWPVPPQKTFVPIRSRRPLPSHLRQRRYEPV